MELPTLEYPNRLVETERTMLDRLRIRYSKTVRNGDWTGRRYVYTEHVPLDPGAWAGTRIIDAIALDSYSVPWSDLTTEEKELKWSTWGKRQSIHGFEVKVSRSDWLTELKDPSKAEAWSRYCNYFWLVASDKSIVQNDLPEGWGLMVPHGNSLRVAKSAKRTNAELMPTPTVVALARSIQKMAQNEKGAE